ncbi:gephyrin-like molybdotransferase Glp [Cellulomonas sp. PhB143]|uniref:molybdopterin molybdotransferase MoeA n=1 Tax=Cellulomonas sp. PhB143 TaxID=2485186 RepID=UPI000F467DEB|nr:gephyrin-like molybdotransferase Glp [Cellulomonas sp. PhB143]ROS72116.1 molybdopterin molybdotransferase [Cellulomonas sp. PhB143]
MHPAPDGSRTPSPTGTRSVEEHLARVLARVAPLPLVRVSLDDAVGAVLGEPLVAAADVPPFDASAMDGYAVRAPDVAGARPEAPVRLRVVGDVVAGPSAAVAPLVRGAALRIMTGAPVPAGADAVVPVELTSTGRFDHGPLAAPGATIEVRGPGRGHVRHRAEDVTSGDLLADAGAPVTSRLASVAACVGRTDLLVHRRPRVVVVSTGNELAATGVVPVAGEIPDSNSFLLAASARDAGADVVRRGAVPDTTDALRAVLDEAAERADLIVTSGGVSAGAMDVVRHLLTTAPEADDADVAAVAMQPGRPQLLARWRGVPVLALPGNPVAAFVSFELFVRPAISRLRGAVAPAPARVTRRAASAWASPAGRLQVVPVVHDDDGRVRLAGAPDGRGSGSHRVSVLVRADALALVPAPVGTVAVGDPVDVVLLGG